MIPQSANDIVSFAKDLERRAHHFFLVASQQTTNASVRSLFGELAANAHEHTLLLDELRLFQTDTGFGSGSGFGDVQFAGSGQFFGGNFEPRIRLTGNEKAEDLIEMGLKVERELVSLYGFLLRVAPADQTRMRYEQLLDEENFHLKRIRSLTHTAAGLR